jgi:DNA-binding NtrC family response regulator
MANLLLVDDDLDMVDAVAEILRAGGHQVRLARNGKEGLARLLEEEPELIVCDVDMPVLNGPEMASQLFVHDAGLEKIPILLMSGVPDLRRVAHCVGTPYFIGKPFSIEQLMDKLNQALKERSPPQPNGAGDAR